MTLQSLPQLRSRTVALKHHRSPHVALRLLAMHGVAITLCAFTLSACKPMTWHQDKTASAKSDSTAAQTQLDSAPFAHGATVYVSAMNCEMTSADARRLNELAKHDGIAITVVFVGIAPTDTTILALARKDLGLTLPTRALRDGELLQYKTIGIARMPMALVIKGKQLSSIVTGETMPKTVGLIEAAFSPKVGQ